MRTSIWLPVLILASVCSGGATAESPLTPPKAGVYAANILIQSASGGGCIDTTGANFAGVLNYAGLSGTQFAVRSPIVQPGAGVVSTQILKVTSGVGTTSPSGTFTWKGAGVGLSWNLSGTFSATLTEIDAFSFVAQVTEHYTNGSACTENQLIAFTRTGLKL